MLRHAIANWMSCLLETIYPGTCAVCGSFFEHGNVLCRQCDQQLDAIAAGTACPQCGKPVASQSAPCPWCLGRGMFPYKRVLAFGVYEEPLRKIIVEAKYRRRWPLAEFLADCAWRLPHVRDLVQSADALLAVPLHLRRHWSRGYNQAAVIVDRLCSLARKQRIRPVWRVRDTPHQTQIRSQSARHANVRDAFKLWNSRAVAGRHILVVDDVITTGATLQSLARELVKGEPASLCALTMATADPRHRDFDSI